MSKFEQEDILLSIVLATFYSRIDPLTFCIIEYPQISQTSSQLKYSRHGSYGVPCSQIQPLYRNGRNC